MIKRLFDITFSFLGLILLSPLFLVVVLLIKRESTGPVFYRGLRTGKKEKAFRIFKFRTMVVDAEKMGGPSTAGDDPRLLKIGHFLKKYQLEPAQFGIVSVSRLAGPPQTGHLVLTHALIAARGDSPVSVGSYFLTFGSSTGKSFSGTGTQPSAEAPVA